MILCLDWDQDLEEGTQEVAGEAQLRKYGKFVENYAAQLTAIEDSLEVKNVDILDNAVDPIYLNYAPLENAAIYQLIDTDNKVLQKVLTVLASLCAEVKKLQQEARDNFFYLLLYFGEGGDEKEALMQMSYVLPHLQELSCFIKRCEQVVGNITQQLSALYTSSKEVSQVINANNIHFQDVFDSLGDLLVVLVTLDAIITNNSTLLSYWQLYAHTLRSVNHNPSNFGLSQEKLKMFGKVLYELENQVLTGNIFKKSLEQSYGINRSALCKNVALAEEFESYLKNCLNELDAKTNEKLDCENTMTWIKTSVLFVMHFNIFGSSDKKLLKQLLDLNKKIPGITLVGYIMWYPEKFLLSHIPSLSKIIDKKAIQQTETLRLNYLQQKAQNLSKELQLLSMQICSWIVKFETFVKRSSSHSTTQDISNGCHLFEQGLQFAGLLSYTLKTVMNLHLALSKPVTKAEVVSLFKLIELLKSVQFMFDRHNLMIGEIISQNTQHLSHQALKLILNAKKLLVQDKCYSEKHLDILSSLILAEKALYGPGTKERRLIIRLAICWANQMHTFSEEPCLVIANILRNLNIMCEIQERLAMICDCSFLYWHRILLPIYFSNIYENKSDFNCMVYVFSALQDCIPVMKQAKQYPSYEIIIDAFKKEVSHQFQKHVIEPLCHSIETDLRLHVHSHLQLDDSNPFNVGIVDFSPLLRVCSLRLFNNFIDIKGYVENYLNETFYNLTTVALHDWKTYGEMRTLARYKFNLDTVEDHLPSQTLEQGLDVLEIMRNINVFVSKYLYNLNNQIFVEKSSKNKHLNTINIKHVANSIRTHGSGIMNTTVNFTYQFLQKKFYIFSQFMFDEHIKSRLIKDIRYFREAKTALEQKYPFERGDMYNRGIRKLGLTDNGSSYLDKFRELITHIGNAMGYVQMIRSGGMHSCSNAMSFIPDLEDIISFEGLSKEVGLSSKCSETASRLDQVISNLTQNLEEGTKYFKLLVDVFAPTFRDSKNIHLKNFYIIVPPLTINFVEHIITAKENMSKKNKTGAAFTDDGFVVGIAYILKLLDQYTEFYSLHWFESVQDKYNNDISALLLEKSRISKDDETLQQTMTLTEKRLLKYKQEFELLNCNLTSVKIFFETSEHQDNVNS